MIIALLTIFGVLGFIGLVYSDSKSLEFKESIKDPIRLKRNLSFVLNIALYNDENT